MDWAALKQEYMTSTQSLRALAKKYNTSYTRISMHSRAEGWVEARRQFVAKTESKVMEKASEKAADASVMLYETALDAMSLLKDLMKGATELSDVKTVTGALKDLKTVLDAKSEADIEEQRARIEKLRKEASQEKDEPKSITVTIEGGGEGWAN